MTLAAEIDAVAADSRFSGVVSVVRDGVVEFAQAYGMAHRGYRIPNTLDMRFGAASASKGFTALVVLGLVERGLLSRDTTARSVLGPDLPQIAADVTVEQLLAHRSGIGDYLDESAGHAITDYVMTVPVHRLATTEDYLAVVDGYPTAFPAGERFAYCNGGYVVLALIAERVSGVPFPDLVDDRIFRPAGMADTAYLRSDELPGRTAIGYLGADGLRSNVLHLPVRGSGDGGCYTTVADVASFWRALFGGRIASDETVADMTRPRSDVPEESARYGLGLWLAPSGTGVGLEGYDAGVSFRSDYNPTTTLLRTVISNSSDGAWPISQRLTQLLSG